MGQTGTKRGPNMKQHKTPHLSAITTPERTLARIVGTLEGSVVGIAGAGGLGSNVAMALARSGVGTLIIVDFDRVEERNLNRQQYFRHQIGVLKVDALRENILGASPSCNVKTLNLRLEPGTMTDPFRNTDVDVLVEALDAAELKVRFIEEALTGLPGVPVVAASGVAGVGGGERLRLVHSGNLHLIQDPESASSDAEPSLAPKVGMMACYQANIVLEILLGMKGGGSGGGTPVVDGTGERTNYRNE